MVHLRSNALESTILKICVSVNIMQWAIELIKTYLLHVDAVTGTAKDEASLHGLCESLCLLFVSCGIRELVFGYCAPDWRSLPALHVGN
jgi:hypothetical protein